MDDISFTVQSLKKNLDKTLTLFQEKLFNAKFTDEAFKRNQRQMLEGLKQAKAQPAFVANEVMAKINYGTGHILGMSESGNEHTIKNITLRDIEGYYNNFISSQDAKVVIVGDIKESEIFPKLVFLDKLLIRKSNCPLWRRNQ